MQIAAVIVAALLLAVAAAIYYSIVFPRQPHQGPLPAMTAYEAEMMPQLKAHVTAIASEAHNIGHYGRPRKCGRLY